MKKAKLRYFPGFVADKLWSVSPRLASIYVSLMSPLNYGLVCGLGFLVNMGVHAIMRHFTSFHWIIVNAAAILLAMLWNWANTVGPLGEYWGFPHDNK